MCVRDGSYRRHNVWSKVIVCTSDYHRYPRVTSVLQETFEAVINSAWDSTVKIQTGHHQTWLINKIDVVLFLSFLEHNFGILYSRHIISAAFQPQRQLWNWEICEMCMRSSEKTRWHSSMSHPVLWQHRSGAAPASVQERSRGKFTETNPNITTVFQYLCAWYPALVSAKLLLCSTPAVQWKQHDWRLLRQTHPCLAWTVQLRHSQIQIWVFIQENWWPPCCQWCRSYSLTFQKKASSWCTISFTTYSSLSESFDGGGNKLVSQT